MVTEKTGGRRGGTRLLTDAVRALKKLLEELDEPREPLPSDAGLGVAQIVPRYIKESPLVSGAFDFGVLVSRFLASRVADARARRDAVANMVAQASRLRPPARTDRRNARSVRFAQERRKICRRSTISACPTPDAVRSAWKAAAKSRRNRLRLGRLLMDLECYVDNDLVVRWYRKRPKIVARNPGIRGWIAVNCPELSQKYKTLMRYKSLATRARQEAGQIDPVPLHGEAAVPSDSPVAIQHRRRGVDLHRRFRFAWEHGSLRIDADGRLFLTNENYTRAVRTLDGMGELLDYPEHWTPRMGARGGRL